MQRRWTETVLASDSQRECHRRPLLPRNRRNGSRHQPRRQHEGAARRNRLRLSIKSSSHQLRGRLREQSRVELWERCSDRGDGHRAGKTKTADYGLIAYCGLTADYGPNYSISLRIARTGAASSDMILIGKAISSYEPAAILRRSRFSRIQALPEKIILCTGSDLL
jgi:hypothetical protein